MWSDFIIFLNLLVEIIGLGLRTSHRAYVRTLYNDSDHDNALTIPTKFLDPKWTPVTALDIICPTEKQLMPEFRISTELGTVRHPHTQVEDNVDGFFCHKQEWTSTCTETWYFSSTEETKISNLEISEGECEEAITLYVAGEKIEPFFPPFICSWASTQSNSKIFVVVTPHSARVDIYENVYRDPSFPGGECRTKVCKTVNKDIMWIMRGDEKRADTCDVKKWEEGPLYFSIETRDSDWSSISTFSIDESWVRSPLYGIRKLKGSCRTPICGSPGIRFSSGEWWGLKFSEDMLWIQKLPRCAGSKVSFHHDNHPGRELEEEAVVQKLKCKEVIGRILAKDNVTPVELASFVPKNPGVGLAYRLFMTRKDERIGLREYRLEKRRAMYHLVHNITRKLEIGDSKLKVGHWYDGVPVYWNTTEILGENTTKKDEIFLTFNGLVKFHGDLYLPESSAIGGSKLVEMNRPGVLLLEEQTFDKISVKNQFELLDHVYKFEFKKNNTNLIQKISSALESAGQFIGTYFSKISDIVWWIGGGIIGLLITGICIKCNCYKFLYKRKEKNTEPKGQELKPMTAPSKVSDNVYATIDPPSVERRKGSSVFSHY
ncbi:glycoprotein [Gray Lodge virus]|uniref:Glycoprotein n=1 Tax=Gray Lodge virus TaxID=1272942 RepID=A0A0D3R1P1_9RHAB|nr:glycoprotein [Gray Lodge virus]AJR28573.1 glycoprotein [Gray Lodge virus]